MPTAASHSDEANVLRFSAVGPDRCSERHGDTIPQTEACCNQSAKDVR